MQTESSTKPLQTPPMLSVVIPVYNVERYLRETLDSVLGQSFKDIEVILVDDGCTDGSPAICDEYARRYPNVSVIHKGNEGAGLSRNRGIEVARGKYITFVDSDDTIHPDTYSVAMELMLTGQYDMVGYNCLRFNDSGDISPERLDTPLKVYEGREDMQRIALSLFSTPTPADEEYLITGSASMGIYLLDKIRKGGIEFPSEKVIVSEDVIFNFEYYLECNRVAWLDRTYYRYRRVGNSITHRLDMEYMHRSRGFCRHAERLFAEKGLPEGSELYTHGAYIGYLRVQLKQVFNSPALTLAEKRKWFKEMVNEPYFCDNCSDYPASSLPWRQRLSLITCRRKLFTATYLIVRFWGILRPDKLF